MIDWEFASIVAITGIVAVFLALGILNITVYLSGLYFIGRQKTETKKREAGAN